MSSCEQEVWVIVKQAKENVDKKIKEELVKKIRAKPKGPKTNNKKASSNSS